MGRRGQHANVRELTAVRGGIDHAAVRAGDTGTAYILSSLIASRCIRGKKERTSSRSLAVDIIYNSSTNTCHLNLSVETIMTGNFLHYYAISSGV